MQLLLTTSTLEQVNYFHMMQGEGVVCEEPCLSLCVQGNASLDAGLELW